jgi:hypothetical protein
MAEWPDLHVPGNWVERGLFTVTANIIDHLTDGLVREGVRAMLCDTLLKVAEVKVEERDGL